MPKSRITSAIQSLILIFAGSAMFNWYKKIAEASQQFEQGTVGADRPIVDVLTWFWFAFAAYCIAWVAVGGWSARRRFPGHRNSIVNLLIVLLFGVAFRIVMTPSVPIQEIDLYRYIWDGAVVSNQLDPYQFSPRTVLTATNDESLVNHRRSLAEYVDIVKRRPGLKRVLEITHYGEYTTPYPPVSQAVFGLAISTVKPNAPPRNYLIAMKTALVLFDFMTGIIIVMLLYHVGMNTTLSLAYFWCPLVIKEIANGGHLDSIATFFAVLAIYLTTRALWTRPTNYENNNPQDGSAETHAQLPPLSALRAAASAVALACAFAAKVFPIVLAPIWFVVLFRRIGFPAVFAVVLFIASATAFSIPMLKHMQIAKQLGVVEPQNSFDAPDASGIEAFSKYWEMNDFLFMLVVENLKPDNPDAINKSLNPWFRITSNDFRQGVIAKTRNFFETPNESGNMVHKPSHFAFFATRVLTLAIFSIIVGWACLNIWRSPTSTLWLEMAFLLIAWFWLLSPTQNPWYWTWSVPLLVFARGRVWIFLSGTLLAYYLRFWFEYQFTGIDVMRYWKENHGESWIQSVLFPWSEQCSYPGTLFFDFYVPVLEFGPWLLLLFLGALVGYFSGRGTK